MTIRDFDGKEWAVTLQPEPGYKDQLDGRGTVHIRDTGTNFITMPISVLMDAAAEYVRIKRIEAIQEASAEDLFKVPMHE